MCVKTSHIQRKYTSKQNTMKNCRTIRPEKTLSLNEWWVYIHHEARKPYEEAIERAKVRFNKET